MKRDGGLRIFRDATAIVTGGASGIGRSLALELARRGAEVVIADVQDRQADEVASLIRSSGGTARAAKLDVRDFDAVKRLVDETVQRNGRLDYYFNNAGVAVLGPASRYTVDDWNLVVDINLRGQMNVIQAAYPVMMRQRFGQIVNTSSLAGLTPSPGNIAYAATKFAIVGLSQSLRIEAALHGVRINVVCPGVVNTPMLRGAGDYNKTLMDTTPEQAEKFLKKMRPLEADDFVKKALKQVMRDKGIIIVPASNKPFIVMYKLFPETIVRLLRKAIGAASPELLR